MKTISTRTNIKTQKYEHVNDLPARARGPVRIPRFISLEQQMPALRCFRDRAAAPRRWRLCSSSRESAPLGARASRPQVDRRPTGVFMRARCPRSQGRRQAERPSLGSRASRPQVGRRPTGVFMRARCPRSRGRRQAERPSLGARASRPQVGRRPTGVFMRARCPRSQGKRRAERASLGARASRPQVGRRPTGVFMRARCPRSQGKRRAERASLGARASRPQVGRRPTGVLKRARRPRSRENRANVSGRMTNPRASTFVPECLCGIESLQVPWALRCKSSVPCPD